MTQISIITPSLNQGRFLSDALESVRLQGHASVEHLVLDGGSTDNTISLLKQLDGSGAWKHLHWHSELDGGQSEALNRGFQLASGEIIGWLNSDDRYRPGCFDHVVEAFAEHPKVDVFYGDFTLINEDGKTTRVRREIGFNHFILLYYQVLYIPTPSTFFRRRIFDEGHMLNPNLHYAMDYEYFLRLAQAGYRIQHLPHVLADFRVHRESKSCSRPQLQAIEKQQVMWSVSPLATRIHSPALRRLAFLSLQSLAGALRWSEKFLRGYYFTQFRPDSLNR